MSDICDRPGCNRRLGDGYVSLPEDRHKPNPPRFHSTDCAVEERFRRKYAARVAHTLDAYGITAR